MGSIFGKIRKFGEDERGMALILVSIMLPVLIGFALLAIDMSRANSLHNDLQRGADALAIAAAAELDGRSDSISRANSAIANLVDNFYRFSSAGPQQPLTSSGIAKIFLKSLPANDSTSINPTTGVDGNGVAHITTDPLESRFVLVSVTPVGFAAIFPVSGGGTFNIGATAVAGFRRSICEVTPMFICNPFESAGKSFQQAFAEGLTYSREFRSLKTASAPGPGNFGLLDTDIPLRDAFAVGTTGTCYKREAVETKTGVTLGHVNTGLNVRFDIYRGPIKDHDDDPAYRPATNVRKGADKTSNCNKFKSATDGSAMGFPEGDNYSSATGMTDAGWNRSGYWTLNHGGTMPTIASSSHPTSTTAAPSRYDVYKYEIANNRVADESPAKETGVPACYSGPSGTLTNLPDRRLITLAVVDCTADATKIAGHTELNPDAYASIFLTNPIEKEDNDEDETANEKPIRFEVVDVEGPLGNGTLDNFLRDEAQLYR